MDKIIDNKIGQLPNSKKFVNFKSLLTSLKHKDYDRTQKIIKGETNKQVKRSFLELTNHVRSIKTDVKYIPEDKYKEYVYEDMTINNIKVKIIFDVKNLGELTEFLSSKTLKVVVRKIDTQNLKINKETHMVFNHAECYSPITSSWLNCMVGVQYMRLFKLIKDGVMRSKPGFQPSYVVDFLKGYMEYKLKLVIQDFNRFLAERNNFLYSPSDAYILYKFKIEEAIRIIIGNPERRVFSRRIKNYEIDYYFDVYPQKAYTQRNEAFEIEKEIVFKNAFKNFTISDNINPSIRDKLTITIRHGNFSETSDSFQYYDTDKYSLDLQRSDEKYLRSQGIPDIYTGLYNGKYFQTWYIGGATTLTTYIYPPTRYEKRMLIKLIDKEFYEYVRYKERYNKYNISEEKRQEIAEWLADNTHRVPVVGRIEDNLIDFKQYRYYGEELMPPVKGFPSNRIVQDYDEMEIDF